MNSNEDPALCNSKPTPAQKNELDRYFIEKLDDLYAYADLITHGHPDARDWVHQANIEMWAAMRKKPDMTTIPAGYGFGVVKNLWYRWLRERGQMVSLTSIPEHDDAEVQSAMRELERQATKEYLRDEHFTRPEKLTSRQAGMLIRWLPEELQPIVLMKSEGHSFEAIAAAAGMSVDDAKRKYNSARTRLRSLLKKLLSRGEG